MLYQGRRGKPWAWFLAAATLSGLGLLRSAWLGGMPPRFPPDIGWVLLGAAPAAALSLTAFALDWLSRRELMVKGWALRLPLRPLMGMGRSSLFYLLLSNLVLFTLAGKNTAPWLKFRAPGLFGQPVQTAFGAFWWTLALLGAVALAASFTRAPERNNIDKEETPCVPSA